MSQSRHKIAEKSELSEPGARIIKEINGQEIALFNIEGEFYAVANYCIHQAGPLCEGQLSGRVTMNDDGWNWDYVDDGKIIKCPWHTWRFDVTSGKNVEDERYTVPTYDVEIDDDEIFVLW